MHILVKLDPNGVDTDWGFRGPFNDRAEAHEAGKAIIQEMHAKCENPGEMTLDLHGLYFHPASEGDLPQTVTELEILKLGGERA